MQPETPSQEPDPRFTLANERTFLAWIRTALALMAAGAASITLLDDLGPQGMRRTVGALLLGLGALIAFLSTTRWKAADRAIREGTALPRPMILPIVAFVVGSCAVVLLVFSAF